jgi:hypothetical protein
MGNTSAEHVEEGKSPHIQTEVVRRDINVRTVSAAKNLLIGKADGDFPVRILCECGLSDCEVLIKVPFDIAMADKRTQTKRFFLSEKHVDKEYEKIVEEYSEYVVVEKYSEESQVSKQPAMALPDKEHYEKMGVSDEFSDYYFGLLDNGDTTGQ